MPGRGWAAERRFYKVSNDSDIDSRFGSISFVDWGRVGARRMDQWVTTDALYAPRTADRV